MKQCFVIGVIGAWMILTGSALATQGSCPPTPQGLACLAENGDAEAQYNYGLALLYGEGVEEDRLAALKWLDRAAKAGHQTAARTLAAMALSTEPGENCFGK